MDEIARWQDAIYELCKEHKPDVDGSGCDSGDELDLTLAEINEVFIMYQNEIHYLNELVGTTASSGSGLIATERDRQKRVEGFDDAHDAQWTDEQLAEAAAFYAIPEKYGELLAFWPFSPDWNKKSKHSRIRQLMIAGALIAAEIDRLRKLVEDRDETETG